MAGRAIVPDVEDRPASAADHSHHTEDALEARLTIVFAALEVARVVQDATGLAIANLVKQLRTLRTSMIAINGTTEPFPPQIPPAQWRILDDLGFDLGY